MADPVGLSGQAVLFRVDASIAMGIGHVMRCLTLADRLTAAGAECWFVCRAHPGHLAALIRQRGYAVELLPAAQAEPTDDARNSDVYASWLGVSQQADADAVVALLAQRPADWVVVDHYALDAHWERQVQQDRRLCLVIDDLANRPHDCDLLLDQTLGQQAQQYRSLVPRRCRLLLGADYALLRPQFQQQRALALARRHQNRLQHLLISLGGSDPHNVTAMVLHSLLDCALPEALRITVVMGGQAPHLDSVRALAEQLPWSTEVQLGVEQMAPLMASADLAIGAAGTTSWERCCLGLPTVVIQMADNQAFSAQQLQAAGAALVVQNASAIGEQLPLALARLLSAEARQVMARQAARLVDGLGANRVATLMAGLEPPGALALRLATTADCRQLYRWQRQPGVRRFFRHPQQPTWVEHRRWFQQVIRRRDVTLYIIVSQGAAVGYMRLDWQRSDQAEVSVLVDQAYRGQGIAVRALAVLAHRHAGLSLVAQVKTGNKASIKTFRRAGFRPGGRERYVKKA